MHPVRYVHKEPVVMLKNTLLPWGNLPQWQAFPLRVRRSSTECESITIASDSITVCDSLCGTIFSMSHLDGPVRFLLHKETLLVFLGFPLFWQNSSLNWRRFDVPSLRLCLCSVTQQARRTNDGLSLLHPGTLGMVCDVVFPQIQVLFFLNTALGSQSQCHKMT